MSGKSFRKETCALSLYWCQQSAVIRTRIVWSKPEIQQLLGWVDFIKAGCRSQRPRIDLNKMFLPRPNTTTAWKLMPHRSKISKCWTFLLGKMSLNVITAKLFFKLAKISFWKIYADFRPIGYKFSCCDSLWSS